MLIFLNKSQINNLTWHLREIKTEKQAKSKVSRRKEITQIKPEINEFGNSETIENINKTKNCFWTKLKKSTLDRLRKRRVNK